MANRPERQTRREATTFQSIARQLLDYDQRKPYKKKWIQCLEFLFYLQRPTATQKGDKHEKENTYCTFFFFTILSVHSASWSPNKKST
jgi:hypothetical protein